jgi:asparagine synthase (glutamine-hydrolysing)
MSRFIPREIVNREKQGFSAPDASWFKGESINFVHRTLLNKRARVYDLLDYATVASLIEDHLQGRQNRRLFIWSLLYLEEWCKQYH